MLNNSILNNSPLPCSLICPLNSRDLSAPPPTMASSHPPNSIISIRTRNPHRPFIPQAQAGHKAALATTAAKWPSIASGRIHCCPQAKPQRRYAPHLARTTSLIRLILRARIQPSFDSPIQGGMCVTGWNMFAFMNVRPARQRHSMNEFDWRRALYGLHFIGAPQSTGLKPFVSKPSTTL